MIKFEDKIYKKCNLEYNDSISTYNGWGAQQNWKAFETFWKFLYDVKPNRILEIGTSIGGFTQFLNYCCKSIGIKTDIISLDIHKKDWYIDIINEGVDIRIENIFLENYQDIPQFYKNFIQNDGVTIVLCDGGDKIKEFNLLSRFIKSGDFILAHDYSLNKNIFEQEIKNKIWNWCEITEDDITESVLENNLESYKPEVFSQAVWVCKIKK